MIIGSQHKEIEILGRLKAALRVLEDAAPSDAEARRHWDEATKHARKAMLRQWDKTAEFIECDDT